MIDMIVYPLSIQYYVLLPISLMEMINKLKYVFICIFFNFFVIIIIK